MGNASSKGGAGLVIVAEAIEPLPRYSDICAILGGVNKREHMILKATTGVGFGGGKFTVKDCKGDGNTTLIKAENKASRKRTMTNVATASGVELLNIEGIHECVGFRKGCIMSPRGIPGGDDGGGTDFVIPGDYAAGASAVTGASSVYNSSRDIAFAARALDFTFFDWGIELRNLSTTGHGRAVTIWTEENPAMGTVDFTHEGKVIARIATAFGGSILWNGDKYEVGKNGIAIVVAPGMDWVLVSTLCFLLMSRKADHDAGLSTRAGDLSLLSKLFESTGDPDALSRSTSSIGTRSSGGGKSARMAKRMQRDRIMEEE